MPSGIYKRTKEMKTGKHMLGRKGEQVGNWKGDKVSYVGLHQWVKKWKGRPNKCEMCGTEKKRQYDWANIDHKYRRVLEDYIRMCRPCHRNYDLKRGIKINKWQTNLN